MARLCKLNIGLDEVDVPVGGCGVLTQDGRLFVGADNHANASAFFRSGSRCLWVAGAPGTLFAGGHVAVGGVVGLAVGHDCTIRAAGTCVSIRWVEDCTFDESHECGRARCALSGEPLELGDDIVSCFFCSTTVLERFARRYRDYANCPRCGRRLKQVTRR